MDRPESKPGYYVMFPCQNCGKETKRWVSGRGAMPRYCEACSVIVATQSAKTRMQRWREANPDRYSQQVQKDNSKRKSKRTGAAPLIDVTGNHVPSQADHFTSKYEVSGYPASVYQAAIFEAVLHGTGDILVVAAAGSGKSTTMVESIKLMLQRLEPGEILAMAFNTHIHDQLKKKLEGTRVPAQTIHSVGFQVLADFLKSVNNVEKIPGVNKKGKYREIVDAWLNREVPRRFRRGDVNKVPGYWEFRDALIETVEFARLALTDPRNTNALRQLAERFGCEPKANAYWIFDGVRPILEEGKRKAVEEMNYDFTDMVWLPVALNLSMPKIKFMCIDEAQDLNALQREFVLSMRAPGGRILWVGDPDQSIMAFAGADVESFYRIKDRTNAQELPLSISYRCPTSHVEMAKRLVPSIEARPGAPEGLIETITPEQLITMAERGDMIICRRTAPLISMALKFIAAEKPARVRGQEGFDKTMSGLLDLIVKKTNCSYRSFESGVKDFIEKEKWRLQGRENAERQLEVTQDKCDSLLAIYRNSDAQNFEELKAKIIYIFESSDEVILLSTVHRAKGLEADRVFILQPETMPLEWKEQQAWEYQQELHIKYVALTRAKQAMYLVPDPKRKNEKPQEQPVKKTWISPSFSDDDGPDDDWT